MDILTTAAWANQQFSPATATDPTQERCDFQSILLNSLNLENIGRPAKETALTDAVISHEVTENDLFPVDLDNQKMLAMLLPMNAIPTLSEDPDASTMDQPIATPITTTTAAPPSDENQLQGQITTPPVSLDAVMPKREQSQEPSHALPVAKARDQVATSAQSPAHSLGDTSKPAHSTGLTRALKDQKNAELDISTRINSSSAANNIEVKINSIKRQIDSPTINAQTKFFADQPTTRPVADRPDDLTVTEIQSSPTTEPALTSPKFPSILPKYIIQTDAGKQLPALRKENISEISDISDSILASVSTAATAAIPSVSGPAYNPVIELQDNSENPKVIHTPFGKTGWTQEISQQVVMLAKDKLQTISLVLNPPNLGPLQVVVKIENQIANVQFSSQTPAVLQTLREGLPVLQAMLGTTGLQLGNTEFGNRQAERGHRHQSTKQGRSASANDEAMIQTISNVSSTYQPYRRGLINLYV